MRRFLILLSLAGLVALMLPGVAHAAKPSRDSEDAVVLSCETEVADGYVSMFAVVSDVYGAYGDLAFWEAGAQPYDDPPTLVTEAADVTGGPAGIDASFDLVEYDETMDPPYGASAGTAELAASFSPDGDPVAVNDQYRNGNRWERVTGSVQALVADGTLVLPGDDLDDLSGCYAEHQMLTYASTNPSAYIDRFEQFVVSCDWGTQDGEVQFSVFGDAFGAFTDVFVSDPSSFIEGFGDATLTPDSVDVTVELVDSDTQVTVGSATASASLAASGERVRSIERAGRDRTKEISELYSVDGTLDVTISGSTTSYPMDADHCFAADQRIQMRSVRPNGPKPGPLANDGPDGAARIRVGHTDRVVTGGNAEEPEASCTTTYGDDPTPQDVPISYTAWWTVTGTGGSLTADSAGSDFDTVVGIYVQNGSDYDQIVCVDDVFDPEFSLQAAATWASQAGTTYYIQAGGYGGSTGHLTLAVR